MSVVWAFGASNTRKNSLGTLEWQDNNLPVSTRFDDPYYSRHDGRAETEHVFIKGNGLHERWPNMAICLIAELGFGTGLNFLETVHQWTSVAGQSGGMRDARLEFVSFERYPLSAEDIAKAHSAWPELDALSERLQAIWNPAAEKLEVEFAPDIKLKVCFGDANTLLPRQVFHADAWYLDGFSPAKNPELWNEALMLEVARHTAAGGTFATYTAAGHVRRSLQAAGFDVDKTKGFGRKREMLTGRIPNDINVADGH